MEKSAFFNSSGGDRVYDAADFASYFGKLVSNGIFNASPNNLKVTAGTGMKVLVQAGSAWINGYAYENTDTLELELATADGNPRIDRVVVRWSSGPEYPAGGPYGNGASPCPGADPNNDVFELGIADIVVAKGVVAISAEASPTRA